MIFRNRVQGIVAGLVVAAGIGLVGVKRAAAEYSGLSVEKHTTATLNGVNRSVWRVYANFTLPGDRLLGVWGTPTLGFMNVDSRNGDDSGVGSPFYNFSPTNGAPTQAAINNNPDAQWDSFFTIGVSIADQAPNGDQTGFSPGFPSLSGTSFSSDNAAYYVVPDPPNVQHRADFAGDGDLALRVLIMQLTVNQGDNVRGTVALSARYDGEGDGVFHTFTAQTFNSVPAPGALALSALAGGLRRRRRG